MGECTFSPIMLRPFAPTSAGQRRDESKSTLFNGDQSVAVLFWVYYVSCLVPIMHFDLYVGVLFLFQALTDDIIALFCYSNVEALYLK